MANYRVISSDNHVFEPPDLWTTRIDPRFKDRAPRIVRIEDGSDTWVCGDQRFMGTAPGAQAGRRFDDPETLTREDTFENVLPGGYIPEEHVKDMDIDGIDVSIVYPTAGLLWFRVEDSELLSAIFRAYNDWLAEFCKPFTKRLKGISMINVDDVQDGVKELERCAKMGFAGAMITVFPPEEWGYDNPRYEPLWAAAQDLEMPLSLHITTVRLRPNEKFVDLIPTSAPSFLTNVDHWVRMSIGHMIFNGVFERYPKLQVGSVEMELSWVPHFLDRMDYNYTQRAIEFAPYRFKGDLLPSDFFRSNVFLGFQEDGLGIRDRNIIGVDNLLWGSDYPHPESTFPRSREIIDEILAGCTEDEKAKIVGGNAARIYNL
jgi:predicted TIM-barrel fold metal-dependent hydrolase